MARYYAPELGRFISEDPARDGLNWYVYCGNNPLRFVDPTGLWEAEGAINPESDDDNSTKPPTPDDSTTPSGPPKTPTPPSTNPPSTSPKLIVSPGHGMKDQGDAGGQVKDKSGKVLREEIDYVYLFCKLLYGELDDTKLEYVNLKKYIEDTTKDHSPLGRIAASDVIDGETPVWLHLGVHADAGSTYEGITMIYIDGRTISQKIAQFFATELEKGGHDVKLLADTKTYASQQSVKMGGPPGLPELRDTKAPAALIEIGSIQTKESTKVMVDRMAKLAEDLALALVKFERERPNR